MAVDDGAIYAIGIDENGEYKLYKYQVLVVVKTVKENLALKLNKYQ